jgi:hypothetical protein
VEGYQAELGVEPAEAPRLLRATTLAMSHPLMTPKPVPPRQIAQHFLYGVVGSRC